MKQVNLPIKQRDVSFENLESKTFEELENTKVTELQDKLHGCRLIILR